MSQLCCHIPQLLYKEGMTLTCSDPDPTSLEHRPDPTVFTSNTVGSGSDGPKSEQGWENPYLPPPLTPVRARSDQVGLRSEQGRSRNSNTWSNAVGSCCDHTLFRPCSERCRTPGRITVEHSTDQGRQKGPYVWSSSCVPTLIQPCSDRVRTLPNTVRTWADHERIKVRK